MAGAGGLDWNEYEALWQIATNTASYSSRDEYIPASTTHLTLPPRGADGVLRPVPRGAGPLNQLRPDPLRGAGQYGVD